MPKNDFKYNVGDQVVFMSSNIVRYLREFQGDPIPFDQEVEESEFNGTIMERFDTDDLGNWYNIMTDFHVYGGIVPEGSIIGFVDKKDNKNGYTKI